MKKLILFLVALSGVISARAQCGYMFNDFDNCTSWITYFNNDDFTTHYIVLYNRNATVHFYGDTLALNDDTVTGLDIQHFKTAYNRGDHAGLYRPISYVPSWTEVTGKPSFTTVATSGDYNDLFNKPTIFSGAYGDLTGKPLLFDGQYSSLTGVPSTFAPSAHTHAYSSLTGIPSTFTPSAHNHSWSNITSGVPTTLAGYGITDPIVLTSGSYSNPSWITGLAWSKISGVPSTFTPSTHTHAWTDITGAPSFLTSEVDGSTTNEIELPSQTGQSGKLLTTNGTTPSWTASPTAPGTNNATGYGSGTVYSLTTSSAKVDFGTTDPSLTIPTAGTYLIISNVKIEYAGLTTVAGTASFKLRRTNNTAADLSNSTTNFNYPAVTLLTQTGGDADLPPIIYTTSNSNDVIEVWGNRAGGLTVGNVNVGEASIVAIRIY